MPSSALCLVLTIVRVQLFWTRDLTLDMQVMTNLNDPAYADDTGELLAVNRVLSLD
jgi:hypothetical protein